MNNSYVMRALKPGWLEHALTHRSNELSSKLVFAMAKAVEKLTAVDGAARDADICIELFEAFGDEDEYPAITYEMFVRTFMPDVAKIDPLYQRTYTRMQELDFITCCKEAGISASFVEYAALQLLNKWEGCLGRLRERIQQMV